LIFAFAHSFAPDGLKML